MAILLPALVVLTLVAFFARAEASRTRQRSARVAQAGASPLLSTALMEYGLWLAAPAARAAAWLHIHPDLLSWGSLAFHVGAGVALSQGAFVSSAWLLLFGGACDSLDGTVARARGIASDAGEVLDAVIDRWAELAVYFGLAYHYRDSDLGLFLCLLAAAGSLMVSYTRAKAQAMNAPAAGGLMQRHERAAYLMVAVLLSAVLQRFYQPGQEWPTLAALGLIGVLASYASMRRTHLLRRALRAR